MHDIGIKNSSSYQEKCVNCNQTFTSKLAYINHEKSCKLNIIQIKRKNSQFKTTKIGFFKSNNTIHQLHEDAINDVISLITNVTNKDPKELGIPNNAKEVLKFIDLIGDNLSQDWFETETIMYNDQQNKENAKVFLEYIPIINNANVEVYLQNYHKSIEILLHPLLSQYNSRAWITVNGEPKHFYIFLSYGISDMKEANNACAAYQSYNALFSCYSCLVLQKCLFLTDHNLIFPGRFTHNIRSYFMDNSLQEKNLKNELHKLSLHPIKNSFWNHKNFEVYTSFVPDIMHVCDLGLFVYIINFTMEKLKKESQSEKKIKFLNNWLSLISRYYKLLSYPPICRICRSSVVWCNIN
ncbi:hypothetical protein GLOIN_2v1486846 [Rhizophagus clarus]|uniref:Uncharacterized protein n=1 Tax=Rhizophagus clarus TaxID=94130 RepID=A0A8H3M1E4_9GLOM|nr:hypothetical protein GLOIN_2v1486846 [Rhizophagus clarus]